MSDVELKFLDQIKKFVEASRREGSSFAEITRSLNEDFRSLLPHLSNLDQALEKETDLHVKGSVSPTNSSAESVGHMPETEGDLLDDILKLIDFTIRNGLEVRFVLTVLTHDLGEIERNGGSLDQALGEGFSPKVSGWARLDEDSFGETEEPIEVL